MIPLRLFRDRNTAPATFASLFVGVALFSGTVFLSHYFQVSRGKSPTVAGLMSLPMIAGLVLSSLVVGRIITRTSCSPCRTVGQADLGVASSTVAFFRSLGGAIGVSVLGALLGHQLASGGRLRGCLRAHLRRCGAVRPACADRDHCHDRGAATAHT